MLLIWPCVISTYTSKRDILLQDLQRVWLQNVVSMKSYKILKLPVDKKKYFYTSSDFLGLDVTLSNGWYFILQQSSLFENKDGALILNPIYSWEPREIEREMDMHTHSNFPHTETHTHTLIHTQEQTPLAVLMTNPLFIKGGHLFQAPLSWN